MRSIFRSTIIWLLLLALGLPLACLVLRIVGGLLGAMGDAEAAYVLERINVAVSILWLLGVVGLVVALGLNAASEPVVRSDDDELDEPPQ
jgi:tetrahydromethanopterin S-methyltransferase subunit D